MKWTSFFEKEDEVRIVLSFCSSKEIGSLLSSCKSMSIYRDSFSESILLSARRLIRWERESDWEVEDGCTSVCKMDMHTNHSTSTYSSVLSYCCRLEGGELVFRPFLTSFSLKLPSISERIPSSRIEKVETFDVEGDVYKIGSSKVYGQRGCMVWIRTMNPLLSLVLEGDANVYPSYERRDEPSSIFIEDVVRWRKVKLSFKK